MAETNTPDWTAGVPVVEPDGDLERALEERQRGERRRRDNRPPPRGWEPIARETPTAEFLADWENFDLPPDLTTGAPGKGLFFRGLFHRLVAHPGSFKTTLAMAAAVQALTEEVHVFWFDNELGAVPARRRMREVGATQELLGSGYWHYFEWPYIPATEETGEWLEALLRPYPLNSMVVFDSEAQTLAAAGLEESNSDIAKWERLVLTGLKPLWATVILIDHPTMDATGDRPYSGRGGGVKAGTTDREYWLEVVEGHRPTRTRQGVVRVLCHKDRWDLNDDPDGAAQYWHRSLTKAGKTRAQHGERYYAVGDGAGMLPIQPAEAPEPPVPERKLTEEAALFLTQYLRAVDGEVKTGELRKAAGRALALGHDLPTGTFKDATEHPHAAIKSERRGYWCAIKPPAIGEEAQS